MTDIPNPQTENESYLTPYVEGLRGLLDEGSIGAYRRSFQAVPNTLLKLLRDFSTAEYIEEKLGRDFILGREQKRGIARVIRDVLLGDLYMGDMGSVLSKQYGIDWEAAKNIVQRIQIQLFTPALEDIKKIQKEKFANRINPAPSYSTDRQTIGGGLGAGQVPATPPPIPPARNVYQPQTEVNPENVVNLRNPQQ